MLTPKAFHLAKIVWDYHHMNTPLQKVDCIFVLGSSPSAGVLRYCCDIAYELRYTATYQH